jgi:hypothetical protein
MVFAFGECELGPDLYEWALSTRVNAARRAIGESGSTQGYIRTVARRGFRFMGAVDVCEPGREEPADREFLCGAFACNAPLDRALASGSRVGPIPPALAAGRNGQGRRRRHGHASAPSRR